MTWAMLFFCHKVPLIKTGFVGQNFKIEIVRPVYVLNRMSLRQMPILCSMKYKL